MALDPRIILGGRQTDLVNTLARSNIAAAGANQIKDQNALRQLYQEQGPGIMSGDQGAMNAFAQLNPQQAFGMNQQRQSGQRASEAHNANMQDRLRGISAQDAAKHAAEIEAGISRGIGLYQSGDLNGLNQLLQSVGEPPLSSLDQFPALAAQFGDVLETLKSVTEFGQGPKDTTAIETLKQRAALSGLQPNTPEYQAFMAQGGKGPLVTVNTGDGGKLTPFQLEADKKFAPEYNAWISGGGSDMVGQIAQIGGVLEKLESGEELTGPLIGVTPDIALMIANPDALDARERVEEVVQRNLRVILGAQFTEKEGERLIARAYNPKLSPEKNAARLRRLFAQMAMSARQKQAMVDHVQQNGTLRGYEGERPTMSHFTSAIEGDDPEFGGADQPPTGIPQAVWDELGPEARELWAN